MMTEINENEMEECASDKKRKREPEGEDEDFQEEHEDATVHTKLFKSEAQVLELKGEDRSFEGNQLFIDLVPSSCWYKGIKACVQPEEWIRLKGYVLGRVNYCCECCQAKCHSPEIIETKMKLPKLDLFGRWQYNFGTQKQTLKRIIALCEGCARVTHAKRSSFEDPTLGEQLLNHLMKVTKMSSEEAMKHIQKAHSRWQLRDQVYWKADLSLLTENGIAINEPYVVPPTFMETEDGKGIILCKEEGDGSCQCCL
jgi:hypothetical protein